MFLLEKTFREIVSLPSAICVLKISFPEPQSKLVNIIRKHTRKPVCGHSKDREWEQGGGMEESSDLWALGGVGGQQSWLFL